MPACSAVSQNRLFIKLTVFSLLNVRGKLFMQSIRVRSIFVLTNINGIPEIYFYTTYVTLDMQHVFMGHRIQVRGSCIINGVNRLILIAIDYSP